MRANRRRDTEPERRVRRRLHAGGLRFRVDLPIPVGDGRPVRPDIVFTRARLAVFVDGCFWHGCPEHGRRPEVKNRHYWGPKIARNVERDHEHKRALADAGWTVLRFWEHESPEAVALEIQRAYERLSG
jgi:DNA mismatch endonuclease (patch repair protein)